MPIVVHIGGEFSVTSNISYLMKGWYDRSILNIGRVEIFVPVISSELGDQNFPNLSLCSSNVSDEQYLSLFISGSLHFIVALLAV